MNMDRFALPDNAYDRGYELAEQAAESDEPRERVAERAAEVYADSITDAEPYTDPADLWNEVRSDIRTEEIGETGVDIGDVLGKDSSEAIEICKRAMA